MAALQESFNRESHEYALAGVPVPGCTQVLKAAELISFDHVAQEVLEWKSELGREVHKARHLYDAGKLLSYDPQVANYLLGWTKFRMESGFVPLLSEQWQIAEINGMPYGMQFDAFGKIRGADTLIDVKIGEICPYHAVQLAGYAAGKRHDTYTTPLSRFLATKRAVVQLRSDGSYRLKYAEDRRDFDVFVSALYIASWKKERNL